MRGKRGEGGCGPRSRPSPGPSSTMGSSPETVSYPRVRWSVLAALVAEGILIHWCDCMLVCERNLVTNKAPGLERRNVHGTWGKPEHDSRRAWRVDAKGEGTSPRSQSGGQVKSITGPFPVDIPHNDSSHGSLSLTATQESSSEVLPDCFELQFLWNNKQTTRLDTKTSGHVSQLAPSKCLCVCALLLVQTGVEGIEVARVDRGAIVDVEVRCDPCTGRKMSNSSTSEVLIDYGAKRTSVHHGWPPFDASPKKDHANELLLLVVPKDFLSSTE